MSRTLTAEIEPGDTVEVWEDDVLHCRGVAQEWDGERWAVCDEVTDTQYHIPEAYLTLAEESQP